ncbi:ABC transporter substrate-binding protein [Catenovulum sp. SM1970]|uniref:ABC transporter substrate-binding protein n=1 Tax=Marinifaba aquimaris TaxID=2741323 RepID=UPI001573B97C|nr:ABC transporter substrate-binding protein [Marinifaba aquimaris]NTS77814.1 ABC transporter substrate-binding protein [Marinifaba aquimaris]
MRQLFYTLSMLCSIAVMLGCQKQESGVLKQGVVYCSEGNPESFNPQLTNSATTLDATARQLYNTLIKFDEEDGSITHDLASYWQVSEDGLHYTFQLRRGVQFHRTPYFIPTREFNADDVLFSFNRWRLKDHPFHDTGGGIYPFFDSVNLGENIADIVKVSDYVVRFELNQADHSFIHQLASDYSIILSEQYGTQLEVLNEFDDIDNYPIGTGPYHFVKYQKDAYIRYYANPNYWEGKPKIKQLVFDITTQSSTRLAKILTQSCDVIAYPVSSEMAILEQSEEIEVQAQPAMNTAFWAFNTIKPPFDNPKVRLALSMAVDKDSIMQAVYYGTAFPANGLLPPLSWAYNPKVKNPKYNPAMAQNLLREAGVPFGFTMNIWAMPTERPYNPNALKMAELISQDLEQIGIKVNVVSFEWTTFRRALSESKHDTVLIGWSADTPDPDSFFSPILSCSATIVGANRSVWCNQEFDDQIRLALNAKDQRARRKHYHKAQEILREEMPILPIAHSMRFQAKSTRVTNLNFSPYSGINFAKVEKH